MTPARLDMTDRLSSGLVLAGLFLMGWASLIFKEGYTWPPVLFFLAGLLSVRAWRTYGREAAALLPLAIYGLFSALNLVYHQGLSKEIWGYLSYAAAWPIYIAVRKTAPPPSVLFMGAAAGALCAFSWSLWQKVVLGVERASGHIYVIQYGNLGLLLGVISIIGLLYLQKAEARRWQVVILIAGGLAGLGVSLLSGSRGGWVGLPVIFWILWRAFKPFMSSNMQRMLLLALALLMTSVLAIPQTNVAARLQAMVSDVHGFMTGGGAGTSVGDRLHYWQRAPAWIAEAPLMGRSQAEFQQRRSQDFVSGKLQASQRFGHMHNDFLELGVKRGIFAMAIYVWCMLTALYAFKVGILVLDIQARALALTGLCFVFMAIDFGLSDVYIEHRATRYVFFSWLPVIYALYMNSLRTQPSVESRP